MSDDIEFGAAYDNEDGERPFIATGNYIVTCMDVVDGGKSKYALKKKGTQEAITDDEGNPIFPDQWKWKFRVDDVDSRRPNQEQLDLVGKTILRWSGKGMGSESHTRLFIEALVGRKLADGERPKKSQFVNRRAYAGITAREGKIIKGGFMLSPATGFEDDDEQPPTDLPAANPVEQMAQQAQGGSISLREQIMSELYDLEDRRDLGPMVSRIADAGLSEDEEVSQVYDLTYTRLAGGARQLKRNTQQPALTQ